MKYWLIVMIFVTQSGCSGTSQELHQSISKEEFEKAGPKFIRTKGHEAILKVCSTDTRTNAQAYEKNRTVRLVGKFGKGQAPGTGFLVGERCVITAGHVVFNTHPDKGRVAFADSVVIEFDGQKQESKNIYTVSGWLGGVDECDYGAIILPKTFAGADAFRASDDGQDGQVAAGGYPRQKPDMLVDTGTVASRAGLLLKYRGVDSERGQSGGPVFRPGGDAIGIHNESVCVGDSSLNTGVRISGKVKDNIEHWRTK